MLRIPVKSDGKYVRTGFLFNLLLVCSSLLVMSIAGEVVLRHLSHKHPRYPQGLYCKPDPLLGWIGRPGVVTQPSFAADDMDDMHIHMNSDGCWDDPHKRSKPQGVKRIIFLGDSFTIGYGVDRPFRFTDMMKEKLPGHYEIVNMALWGYGTDQEFLLFKEKALQYKPDIVGLVLFLDDLYTTNLFSVNKGEFIKSKFVLRSDGSLSLTNVPVPDNHTKSLFFNFIISRVYHVRNFMEIGRTFMRQGWVSVFDRGFYEKKMHVLTLRLISEIHSLALEHAIKFFLVIVPFKEQVLLPDAVFQALFFPPDMSKTSLDIRLPQKVIGSFAGLKKIAALDLYPYFKEHAKPASLFFKHDIHWTKEGHQLVADETVKFLRSKGYI